MKNLDEIKKLLNQEKAKLLIQFRVKKIAIFGSYVRGEEKKNSDLDILVEFIEPIGFFKFLDLEEYLKKLLKIKIDLVSKKALKPRIGKHILQEIIPI